MAALIVETGEGVANADSVVTLEQIAAYATLYGLVWPDGLDEEAQNTCARLGNRYLADEVRWPYRGMRQFLGQMTAFPRTGAFEFRGQPIPENYIPPMFKNAACLAAIRIANSGTLVGLEQNVTRAQYIKREKVDVLETEYFAGAAGLLNTYGDIDAALSTLLRNAADKKYATSTLVTATDVQTYPFAKGDFDNRVVP